MDRMKRRDFFGTVAGGAVMGQAGAVTTPEAQTAKWVTSPPVIMAPRTDGVEIVWAVSRLSRGRVVWKDEHGNTGTGVPDPFGFVPQDDEIIRVRIDGLTAGRIYQIQAITEAGDEVHLSEWKVFRTLNPAAESTSFLVWNDTHQNAETLKKLDAISPRGDFFIWNGDTCNDWHEEETLAPTLLHPAGLDVTRDRPLLLVWGNHDVRGKWAFRVREVIATPHGRPFYAFRSGPVAVICLHTGEDKPDSHPSFGGRVAFEALRHEQREWLKEVITRDGFRDAPYRVVFCHIPLRWTSEGDVDYAAGGYDHFSKESRDAWHESLVKWKAQAVISGHTHRAAWIPANAAFPYGQLVGGGPKPESATWIHGTADGNALTLVMKGLDGRVVEQVTLSPVGSD